METNLSRHQKSWRAKIMPAINLIRLNGMSQEDVAKVCMEELASVISADEKLHIMQKSLMKLLTLDLTISCVRRQQIPLPHLHFATWPYDEYNGVGNYQKKPFSFRLEFKVAESATLVGLNLAVNAATSIKFLKFFFTVFKSTSGEFLASGHSKVILNHSTGECVKVTPEIKVIPLHKISILFTFPLINNNQSCGLLKHVNHFAL
jgi:hypothetical protein